MIHSFRGTSTQKLYDSRKSRLWGNIQAVALRKLDQLEEVDQLSDLKQPPGNKLEALHGDRSGQHSIRINDQFRICFVWQDGGAYQVEIVDYH